MKITRRQLRRLINESITGSKYYKMPPRNPLESQMKLKSFEDGEGNEITGLAPTEDYEKLAQLAGHEDESMQRMGYDLATTLQQDELVFPQDGEPYEKLPYEGYDYLEDLNPSSKMSDVELKYYLSDIKFDLLPAVKQAQQYFGDAWANVTAAGISSDGISLADPNAANKAKLLDNLTHATRRAIHIAGKIADEKNLEMSDVYKKIFGHLIPED